MKGPDASPCTHTQETGDVFKRQGLFCINIGNRLSTRKNESNLFVEQGKMCYLEVASCWPWHQYFPAQASCVVRRFSSMPTEHGLMKRSNKFAICCFLILRDSFFPLLEWSPNKNTGFILTTQHWAFKKGSQVMRNEYYTVEHPNCQYHLYHTVIYQLVLVWIGWNDSPQDFGKVSNFAVLYVFSVPYLFDIIHDVCSSSFQDCYFPSTRKIKNKNSTRSLS